MPVNQSTVASKTVQMPSRYLISPSTANIDSLAHVSTLLHLLHHRNKNQHRLNIWYRHFNSFRTHISRLLKNYEILVAVPGTHAARHRKKAQDVKTRNNINAELEFWTDVLMSKWSRAFSQLAADLRFGVLGIFLLAVLGEVAAITGVTRVLEERGDREVVEAIEKFGREFGEEESDLSRGPSHGPQGDVTEDDLGEVLVRVDEDDDDERDEMQDRTANVEPVAQLENSIETVESALERHSPPLPASKKRERPGDTASSKDGEVKKKKKRRKNAIDELFGAL